MARRTRFNFKWLKKTSFNVMRVSLKGLPWVLAIGFVGFFSFNVKQMLHADPHFQIETIKVFPSGVLTPSENQFLETQANGKSVFDINLKEVSKYLERNPKVKRAEVIRVLPDQLSIFIATRSPLIQVQLKEGGAYFFIASDQLVLSVQKAPRPDLMILEDFSSTKKSYSVGSLYQNKYFYLLFDILEALKSDPLLSKQNVAKFTMDNLGNVSLILQDGIELKFGSQVALSDSVRVVLNSLLNSPKRAEILYIDLRYRDMIIKKKSQEVI